MVPGSWLALWRTQHSFPNSPACARPPLGSGFRLGTASAVSYRPAPPSTSAAEGHAESRALDSAARNVPPQPAPHPDSCTRAPATVAVASIPVGVAPANQFAADP